METIVSFPIPLTFSLYFSLGICIAQELAGRAGRLGVGRARLVGAVVSYFRERGLGEEEEARFAFCLRWVGFVDDAGCVCKERSLLPPPHPHPPFLPLLSLSLALSSGWLGEEGGGEKAAWRFRVLRWNFGWDREVGGSVEWKWKGGGLFIALVRGVGGGGGRGGDIAWNFPRMLVHGSLWCICSGGIVLNLMMYNPIRDCGLFVSSRPPVKMTRRILSWQGLVGVNIGLLVRFQDPHQPLDGFGSYVACLALTSKPWLECICSCCW